MINLDLNFFYLLNRLLISKKTNEKNFFELKIEFLVKSKKIDKTSKIIPDCAFVKTVPITISSHSL